MHSRPSKRCTRERGVVHIEYIVVLVLVGVIAATSVAAVGPHILDWFAFTAAWLALPVP